MFLGSHNVHGDGGPRLLLRGVKHAQLEALPQHPNQRHVYVNVPHQALLQGVFQIGIICSASVKR